MYSLDTVKDPGSKYVQDNLYATIILSKNQSKTTYPDNQTEQIEVVGSDSDVWEED